MVLVGELKDICLVGIVEDKSPPQCAKREDHQGEGIDSTVFLLILYQVQALQ
jgi:hypothetical protein